MFGIRQYFNERRARSRPVDPIRWNALTARIPLLARYSTEQQTRLRYLTRLFLLEKDLLGAAGLRLSEEMRLAIAAQAVLPVLNIGFDRLDGWREVVVYPGQFRTRRPWQGEDGVVTEDHRVLAGEAAHRGGLVLSWDSLVDDMREPEQGGNVVLHEIAHKLDMENGAANGNPPLPGNLDQSDWTRVMQDAYRGLKEQLDAGQAPAIDPYGATNAAEFFAVISEHFFTIPQHLARVMPAVHRQLTGFYNLEPPAGPPT